MKADPVRRLLECAVLAALYFGAARLGLLLGLEHKNVSSVWPPSGIALAALLLFGYHTWPGVAFGALLANLTTGLPLPVACGIAAGNTLAAALAVYLLRRVVAFHCSLDRIQDVLGLIVLAALCSTMIAATGGALCLTLSSTISGAAFHPAWLTWWLGDAVGVLVVTPALLIWAQRSPSAASRMAVQPPWRTVEYGILFVSLAAVAYAVVADSIAHPFFVFPFAIWAAVRLGPRAVVSLNLAVSAVMITATLYGVGPFVTGTTGQSLIYLQSYVAVVAATSLLLSAAMAERATAESALREGESRLRAILDTAGEGIVTIDEWGTIEMLNPAAERLFGYAVDDVLGRNVAMLMPVPYSHAHDEFLHEYRRSGEKKIIGIGREVVGLRSDGTTFPAELTVSEFRLGDRLMFTGMLHDITERKRTDELLRQSEDRYALAIQGANDGIWDWNIRTNEVYFSPRWKDMLGCEDDEIANRFEEWESRVHPDDRDRAMATIKAHFEGETPLYVLEHRLLHKDGTYRWILARGVSLRDVSGKPVRMAGSHTDITDRKRALEELREARDELELRVHDRTTELARANEEMLRAKEAAEDAALAKSRFLATISHEIRSPMNAVIGMTNLLLSTDLSPEQAEYVEIVRDSGESLLSIINDVLDYSRIEAGRMDLEKQPFSLVECVTSVQNQVAANAAEKGIVLECLIEPGTPVVIVGDGMRLRQILLNLVSNAVKFTEFGEVMIVVSSRSLGADHHEWHFAVHDTGTGISRDRLARLFQPFSQGDASTSRRYGGTGLGLAISKQLCERMGGSMWAESKEGKGSTFHFTLPAQTADVEALPRQAPFEMDARLAERLPLRILLADDVPVNRLLGRGLLAKMGYGVHTAANGNEVLEALEQQPYDVVLMDVQMPGMDGLEASRRIRQRWPDDERPYLIALTANAMHGDREACMSAGTDDYIAKPVRVEQLQAALVRSAQMPRKTSPAIAGGGPAVRSVVERRGAALAITPPEAAGLGADSAPNAVRSQPTKEDASDPVVLDHALVDDLRLMSNGGPPDLLQQVIDAFRSDAVPLVASIRSASAAGDAPGIERAAHALKGAAAQIGGRALAAQCRELEQEGRNGASRISPEQMTDLEAQLERLCAALEKAALGSGEQREGDA